MSTTTFIIHHDRCKPHTWTIADIVAFARLATDPSLVAAATLSAIGIELVASEHFEPAGGTLQSVGYAQADRVVDGEVFTEIADAFYATDGDSDLIELAPLYRGPTQYAIRIPIGDEGGNLEGYEYEIKPTRASAEEYLKSIATEGEG